MKKGTHHSERAKQKLSKVNKGKILSEYTKNKISLSSLDENKEKPKQNEYNYHK